METIDISNAHLSVSSIAITTSIILTLMGVIIIPIIKWIHDVQSKTVEVERKAAETYPTKSEVAELLATQEKRYRTEAMRLERRLDDLYRLHIGGGALMRRQDTTEVHFG